MKLHTHKKFKSDIPDKYLNLNIDDLSDDLVKEILKSLDIINIPEYTTSLFRRGYINEETYSHIIKKCIINSINTYMEMEKRKFDIENEITLKNILKKLKKN